MNHGREIVGRWILPLRKGQVDGRKVEIVRTNGRIEVNLLPRGRNLIWWSVAAFVLSVIAVTVWR